VARRSRWPDLPDVSEAVEKEYERMRSEGTDPGLGVPSLAAKAKKDLRQTVLRRLMTIPPGGRKLLVVRGLTPGTQEPIYLRFKPTRTQRGRAGVQGVWTFYERVRAPDEESAEGEQIKLAPLVERFGVWQSGGFQEIRLGTLGGRLVDESGILYFSYLNLEPDTSVQFDPDGGIEVLQQVGGFLANYYRSLLIILCQIVLLAALALMAGSALSFPVASFLVVAIVIVGLVGPWVEGIHLGYLPTGNPEVTIGTEIAKWAKELRSFFVHGVLVVFPHFARYSPLGDLVNGRLVSWSLVGEAAAATCFLRGFAAMLLAAYIYRRRELARVIA